MSYKTVSIFGAAMIIVGLFLISLSFYYANEIMLIGAILFLVVNILMMFILLSLDMFRRDKIINKAAMIEQGLHFVPCNECGKENVLEDQYCIFCGGKLHEI